MRQAGPENVEDSLSEPLFEIYTTMTNAQFFPQTLARISQPNYFTFPPIRPVMLVPTMANCDFDCNYV